MTDSVLTPMLPVDPSTTMDDAIFFPVITDAIFFPSLRQHPKEKENRKGDCSGQTVDAIENAAMSGQ